jgi:type II secretory pathway component GspD/PulD (secretin)
LNIVASNDIDAIISITLRDVPIEEALSAILSVANYTWVERNNIILITSLTDATNLPADVQGRQIQVFNLDFVAAAAVSEAVTNFLSPIGKVTIAESSPTDNRLTQERLVVEDTPESLARIAAFICEVDRPPRQVQIEAHVLQVNLDDTCRCGVNLDQLIRISGSNLNLTTTGFANPDAPQAFLATLEGGDLSGVIEALQTTTDSKTLGSPKLLVLNEQEARIQVGRQLGFRVTTTTETSTMEGVQFLDVGVVLTIIPRITRDGRVLLHVKPEVSKGEVNPDTGLPEEERPSWKRT